jgi:hypothetical protein
MKVTAVPKFLTPHGAIEFVPVEDVPGHTHRIALDGQLQMLWCRQGTRPNARQAEFFIRVIRALQEGLPKYHYADRNEDPPTPAGPAR